MRLGRDEMVRLMYGGRTSLFIGLTSALITTILATILGLLAGYFRGWTDGVITRVFDVIWSFPVVLLGIAVGTAAAVGGLKIGPLEIAGNSLWIPILIIAVVYTPYMARPIRGEVLAMREKEFVEAATAQGAGPLRIMFGELLPNLWSTVIVFFTLNIANNMLLEASLSFLGAGVQPPNSSWGKMVSLGTESIYSTPLLAFAPGVLILLTVLSLNVFGDGLRDALDPRSKTRIARAEAVESSRRGDDLMARFVIRRLVGMVLVLFAVSLLVFLIFNVIPNSTPPSGWRGRTPTPTLVKSIEEDWGFDESLPVQYVTMMEKVFTGELISYAPSSTSRTGSSKGSRRPSRSASGPPSSGSSSESCSASSPQSGPAAGSTGR